MSRRSSESLLLQEALALWWRRRELRTALAGNRELRLQPVSQSAPVGSTPTGGDVPAGTGVITGAPEVTVGAAGDVEEDLVVLGGVTDRVQPVIGEANAEADRLVH